MHLCLEAGDLTGRLAEELPQSRLDALVDWYLRRRGAPDSVALTIGAFSRNVAAMLGGKDVPKDIQLYTLPTTPAMAKKQTDKDDIDGLLQGFGYEEGKDGKS